MKSTYGELEPEANTRVQFGFKGKREHVVKTNVPSIVQPGQSFDVEIPKGSKAVLL